MVNLAGIFRSIQPFSALVVGDYLLDTYTTGKVKRVSPEAPVLVMEVQSLESRPGGAGNVVLNLATLGAAVFACGRIGNDVEGVDLKKRLGQVDTTGLIYEENYRTPVKNRLIADSQQLLRVDFEKITPLPPTYEHEVIAFLKKTISKVQVVAVSDYGKGFLTNRILESLIEIAKEAHVPVVVDPKGTDFTKYRGASLIKPNLSEAFAAAKLSPNTSLDLVGAEILRQTGIEKLLITRSEAGMSLFDKSGGRADFPVQSKEVKDVTGAGDTVLSVISLALANKIEMEAAIPLANIAAGLSIERLGCVQVTLSEIARRLLESSSDHKIFDENHLFALLQVLQNKRYNLLVLKSDQKMTASLFRAIRDLKSQNDAELLIYIRGEEPNDDLLHFLASLNEVNFIILQTESLKHLCQTIHPHQIYSLTGDHLTTKAGVSVLTSLLQEVY
jgi:rfaE bifunctional protein kinase chain/domain